MHQDCGVVVHALLHNGFSGSGHQNGSPSQLWLRNECLSYSAVQCGGLQLAGHMVLFWFDDSCVVVNVNKGTAEESNVTHLLRCLRLFTACYDISPICEHIASHQNNIAGHISHDNLQSFFHLNPQVSPDTTPVPLSLQQFLALFGDYLKLFKFTIHCLYNTKKTQ